MQRKPVAEQEVGANKKKTRKSGMGAVRCGAMRCGRERLERRLVSGWIGEGKEKEREREAESRGAGGVGLWRKHDHFQA